MVSKWTRSGLEVGQKWAGSRPEVGQITYLENFSGLRMLKYSMVNQKGLSLTFKSTFWA